MAFDGSPSTIMVDTASVGREEKSPDQSLLTPSGDDKKLTHRHTFTSGGDREGAPIGNARLSLPNDLISSMQEKLNQKDDAIRKLQEEIDSLRLASLQNAISSYMFDPGLESGQKVLPEQKQRQQQKQGELTRDTNDQSKRKGNHKKKRGKKSKKSEEKNRKRGKKKKTSEEQCAAIHFFMKKVKQGNSSADDWELLVKAMRAENRRNYRQTLHKVLHDKKVDRAGGKEEEKGPPKTLGNLASVPQASRKGDNLEDDRNLQTSLLDDDERDSTTSNASIEIASEGPEHLNDEKIRSMTLGNNAGRGLSSDLEEEKGNRPSREIFAEEGHSLSTALLINRMERASVEDRFEEEEDDWEGDEQIASLSHSVDGEKKNHPPRAHFADVGQSPSTALLVAQMEKISEDYVDNLEEEENINMTYNHSSKDEKVASPRVRFAESQSTSTALLISQMEQLSKELLVEVNNWEDNPLSDDKDDFNETANHLSEIKSPGVARNRLRHISRGISYSTGLLLQRMEDLNEEVAAEVGNIDLSNSSSVKGTRGTETPVLVGSTSKHSRKKRETNVLMKQMENLGDVLVVEKIDDSVDVWIGAEEMKSPVINDHTSSPIRPACDDKAAGPRDLFAVDGPSPSTALLISRMERLSEEPLDWDSEDDEDVLHETAIPIFAAERPKLRDGRATNLLLQRMDELNEDLAVEVDKRTDKDEREVRNVPPLSAETNSDSSRQPRSTTYLVNQMENLGKVLGVENVGELAGTGTGVEKMNPPVIVEADT